MTSLLEVEDLHVWFEPPHAAPVHAVQGVSFTLQPG
jgi:ABC-type glutathione transport system ATPase component